jgi:hypothetical protein
MGVPKTISQTCSNEGGLQIRRPKLKKTLLKSNILRTCCFLAVIFIVAVSAGSTTLVRRTLAQSSSGVPQVGWGGYVTDPTTAAPIMDGLQKGGYNVFRIWVRLSEFWSKTWLRDSDYSILDVVVNEAENHGIQVYIDAAHNYPPSAYISSRNRQEWATRLVRIGGHYAGHNVVLECVNEYTGYDQINLYNYAIRQLRSSGVHLPLLFNFWWNQKNAVLTDPDNNYAIGRHLYGYRWDSYNPRYPTSLNTVIAGSSIKSALNGYFYSSSPNYLQEALRLKIPNGFVVSELGPTCTESKVGNPSVGNMAFAMGFIREAAKNNVTVICYRVGEQSKKALYESLALRYFGEQYYPSATPA